VDYYRVGPCTAAPSISATGSGSGSALDLRVDAYSPSGDLLGSSNPASGQTAGNPRVAVGMDTGTLVPSGPVGSYLVKVDGVGSGNPLNTGYSDYGSVGTYTLRIDGCATDGTVPGTPTSLALTNN